MPDKMILENSTIQLLTDEGRELTFSEEKLEEMLRCEIEPPLDGCALPDGVKFVEWQAPFLCIVHQLPPHVRQLQWILNDSPAPFGPETTYGMRRLSIPYAVTLAVYCRIANRLALTNYNELYFRNEPLKTRDDMVGYPALLNVSRIDAGGRSRAWICTQNLHADPSSSWSDQLSALLDHTWNGAFTLSSEHHEGASWYGESKGVHRELHPIERWEAATAKNEAFALSVPWKPAAMNVGQLINALLDECRVGHRHTHFLRHRRGASKAANLVTRFVNFVQKAASASSRAAVAK